MSRRAPARSAKRSSATRGSFRATSPAPRDLSRAWRSRHPSQRLHALQRRSTGGATSGMRGQRGYHVPEPFDETAALDWTPLWSSPMRARAICRSPTVITARASRSATGGWSRTRTARRPATTSRKRSARVLELVERDAVGLWWYNRVRRPAVDLDSFDEPYSARSGPVRRAARDLWVLDLTTDLDPVFAALSRRLDHPIDRPIFGFGAHLEPRLGILRAVTEMNQFLTWTTVDLGTEDARDRRHARLAAHRDRRGEPVLSCRLTTSRARRRAIRASAATICAKTCCGGVRRSSKQGTRSPRAGSDPRRHRTAGRASSFRVASLLGAHVRTSLTCPSRSDGCRLVARGS